jgi:hypothetical protein
MMTVKPSNHCSIATCVCSKNLRGTVLLIPVQKKLYPQITRTFVDKNVIHKVQAKFYTKIANKIQGFSQGCQMVSF